MGRLVEPTLRHRLLAAGVCILLAVCICLSLASSDGVARTYSGAPSPAIGPAAEGESSAGPSARASLVPSAVDLTPCEGVPDRLCGNVDVPLDPASPAGAQIPIHFEVIPHTGTEPVDEAILVTSGGPGFSATQHPFLGDFLREQFGPLLENRDLILVDQRGVGLSQAIDCPSVQMAAPADIYAAVAACGAQLGDASALYGSGDVARDIEAVRQALGIDKLNFYGGSYAAVDGQAYAAHFPDHLRSIVLDSPVRIVGFDPFAESSAEAIARTVRLICQRSANCRADHSDAADDLEWLARRLRKHPVDGTGYDADGIPHTVDVTEAFLAKITWNDAGGYVAVGEIAAAAHSLRRGDKVPLLRLAAENDFDIFEPETTDPTQFSAGDSWARSCTDLRFPWSTSASVEQRRAQWEDELEDLEEDDFGPFSVDAWLAPPPLSVFPDPCITWPAPTRPFEPAVPAGTKFARLPVLVLSADLDTGTTTHDAKRVAKLFPGSRFVEIANSGHHTLLNARFDCSAAIIGQFIESLTPGDTSCAPSNEFVFPALGRFPEEAEDARPATTGRKGKHRSKHRGKHGSKHRSEKTDRRVAAVAAVAATTVIDAFKRSFLQSGPDGVGLRGGTFTIGFGDSGATVELTDARFAQDVAVSGTAIHSFESNIIDANVMVDGPRGADGTLNITGLAFFAPGASTWQIRGVLGGRSVDLRVPVT
jgi:pimeloyl-ACP methyl ester carboxylesterase